MKITAAMKRRLVPMVGGVADTASFSAEAKAALTENKLTAVQVIGYSRKRRSRKAHLQPMKLIKPEIRLVINREVKP